MAQRRSAGHEWLVFAGVASPARPKLAGPRSSLGNEYVEEEGKATGSASREGSPGTRCSGAEQLIGYPMGQGTHA